jgi:molybdopterin-guanine dinucleotide biosynthesis protein A
MVQWVAERFAPQVSEVLINANQNIEKYQILGYKVIPDEIGGFAGPLAGLHRGLSEAAHELVATAPCDSPFLPTDLIARLHAAMEKAGADLTVAKTGDQPHPVFCLCRKSVLPSLTDFLASGGRKIDAWYAKLKVVEVLFDDQPDAFSNVNTAAELESFERGSLP